MIVRFPAASSFRSLIYVPKWITCTCQAMFNYNRTHDILFLIFKFLHVKFIIAYNAEKRVFWRIPISYTVLNFTA